MNIFSSSPGSTLPPTDLLDGQTASLLVSSDPQKIAENGPAERMNYLVIATTTSSARSFQNSLAPVEQKSPTGGIPALPSPLLTFARSIEGAKFCLESSSADPGPAFDAVLWEFPQEDSDALVTAQRLTNDAGSVPVIAVLFHAAAAVSQIKALTEAGIFAGLQSMIPAGELSSVQLSELLSTECPLIATPSDSVDQLCQAIRSHSHDIRNPLNCVQMLIDLMRDQLKSGEEISTTTLEQLTSSVTRADAIVSDLSRLAKTHQVELQSAKVA